MIVNGRLIQKVIIVRIMWHLNTAKEMFLSSLTRIPLSVYNHMRTAPFFTRAFEAVQCQGGLG